MVLSKEGTMYHRRDGKWIIYIPTDLARDSQFPFNKLEKGNKQKVMVFVNTAQGLLIVTPVE